MKSYFLSFCVWLISLGIMSSGFNSAVANGRIFFFFWNWIISLCDLSIYLSLPIYILSHVRLCNSTDSSPPGSSLHGIFQARTLKWVAISYSYICMCVYQWVPDCFPISTIVNNVEENVGVQVSLLVMILSSLDIYPEARLLNHRVDLCWSFWRNYMFSTALAASINR